MGIAASPLPAIAAEAQQAHSSQQIMVMLTQTPPHFTAEQGYSGGYGDARARALLQRKAKKMAKQQGFRLVASWPMPVLGLDCIVLAVPDNHSMAHAIAQLSSQPGVAWSQPVNEYASKGRLADADPLARAQPVTTKWNLPALQRLATGRGVRVAIIDSQIDGAHPELKAQVIVARNFMNGPPPGPERHGTSVAGIIGASANNGMGIVGIAPDARLMNLRACRELGGTSRSVCDTFSLAKAIQFAIESRAQIINLSLTGPDDKLLAALVAIAVKRNISIVAAYDAEAPHGGFPASLPGVVAVADERLEQPVPHVFVALGRDVLTTMPGGGWGLVNGSSFAVAHVTGLLALAHQRLGAHRKAVRVIAVREDGGIVNPFATLSQTIGNCADTAGARCTAARGER